MEINPKAVTNITEMKYVRNTRADNSHNVIIFLHLRLLPQSTTKQHKSFYFAYIPLYEN